MNDLGPGIFFDCQHFSREKRTATFLKTLPLAQERNQQQMVENRAGFQEEGKETQSPQSAAFFANPAPTSSSQRAEGVVPPF